MSVTLELLDALKARNGGCSDYRAAKLLGVAQTTVSKYRLQQVTFSAEKIISVCAMLGIDHDPYLLRLAAERAKCDIEREAWEHLSARLAA